MRPSLSPLQARSISRASQAHLNIWHGAIRSGKTLASSLAWLGFAAEGPRGKLLMAGRTLDTLERNVLDPMVELFPSSCREDAIQHTRGANTAIILGRLTHLVGANDTKAEKRIRGITLAGTYVDEASLVPEDFWHMLLGRLSVPGARLFATTNPDHPSHWLKHDFLDREDELDLAAWHFRLTDNPGLDPAFLAHIKAEYRGLWYRRYVDGEWVAAEGAVYGDVWDPDRHVEREVPELLRVWEAIDYGTTNPFVGLLIGLGVDGRLHIFAEWRWDSRLRQRSLTAGQYREELERWHVARKVRPEWVFVDPEEAGFRVELREGGWKGVRAADNSVLEGIRLLSDLMALDKLRVHESCEGLIDEIPGYTWDPEAPEDRPIKVDDHSCDAARYGILSSEFIWRRTVLGLRRAA